MEFISRFSYSCFWFCLHFVLVCKMRMWESLGELWKTKLKVQTICGRPEIDSNHFRNWIQEFYIMPWLLIPCDLCGRHLCVRDQDIEYQSSDETKIRIQIWSFSVCPALCHRISQCLWLQDESDCLRCPLNIQIELFYRQLPHRKAEWTEITQK